MPYPFLSDDWFDATEQLAERFADRLPDVAEKARINVVVTSAPFNERPIHTYIDTSSGQLLLARGALEKSDCTVTTDYATCTSLLIQQDQSAVMQAFMAGKIKVQGDLSKLMTMLMALQATPASDIGMEAAEALKAITTVPAS
jgi:ubiquinone biosynthesis protein UbiJ